MAATKVKKSRIDGQITSLAGEFFVAAELLKRELQTSITFGNAKAIDLLAYNPRTKRKLSVQVKALRRKNVFPISSRKVKAEPADVYVFVLLNAPGKAVDFYIVSKHELVENPDKFGKWYDDPKFPGISPTVLGPFRDNWAAFEEFEISSRSPS